MVLNTTTLLLVEDELLIRKTTKQFLLAKGYRIIEAENGKEGLELFREKKPDLIITDLRMPIMDGMDLMQIVVKEAPEIPIIIFSGMGKMADVIDALRAGAWDYITKPIPNMEMFEYCISKAMERATFLKNEKDRKEYLEHEVMNRTRDLLSKNEQLNAEIRERKVQEGMVLQAKLEWERTVDTMPDMIAIIGKDQRIIRVNEPLLKQLGATYEEVRGKHCFVCLHGCEKPIEFCVHKQLMKDGKQQRVEVFEDRLGGHCEIIVSPFRDQDGELNGSVHIIRNINARVQAEREKEKLHAQLLQAQKLESVGQLASGIAHEINTPTQFIRTNISFLEDALEDVRRAFLTIGNLIESPNPDLAGNISKVLEEIEWDELNKEITEAIQQSGEGATWISSIVGAMKGFSHPGSKSKDPTDINKLIQNTITVARNEWKYVATVDCCFDEKLPDVPCYADEMGQVMLNMIVNAAHSIAEKKGDNPSGEKGCIKFTTFFDSAWVTISISDTGNGIPEDIQQRVFDPFFTTKEVGRGTGQGLAITHDVVTEKHQGKIKLDSKQGEGTTFWVKLPRQITE